MEVNNHYIKSQSDRMIIEAVNKGYYANINGKVFRPDGKEVVGSPLKNSSHLRITLYAEGINKLGYCSVLKHRFVAYYFLGEDIFKYDVIRHKNDIGNDNRIENLIPGSYKENRNDIPFQKLSDIAKINSHLLVARSRKLEDKDIVQMRIMYNNTKISYKELSKLFGVSTMTAYRAVSKQSWKDVV